MGARSVSFPGRSGPGRAGSLIIAVAMLGVGLFILRTWDRVVIWTAASDKPADNTICQPIDDATVRSEMLTLTVAGSARRFEVRLPEAFAYGRQLPIVFVFHGSGGSPTDMLNSGPYTTDLRNGAIFVAPEGRQVHGGFGWDEACAGQDMIFFDLMLACVRRRYAPASDQVDAFGFSWGGDFANALGCCRAPLLRRVVAAGAAEMGTRDGFKPDLGLCTGPFPAYMNIHGAADAAYAPAAFDRVVQSWQKLLACPSATATDQKGCRSYQGCSRPLLHCKWPGVDHRVTPEMSTRAVEFLRYER